MTERYTNYPCIRKGRVMAAPGPQRRMLQCRVTAELEGGGGDRRSYSDVELPAGGEGRSRIKFNESERPDRESPDPQRTNGLKPSPMCCGQFIAAFVANQRQTRKNLTRRRHKTPPDHIDSRTEEI
jgi:hypothetical protein